MKIKIPAESLTIKTEVVCPNDTNPVGYLKGGNLVQWMDIAAAVTAQTHTGMICVTAGISEVNFFAPAKVGDILVIEAQPTRAFHSSLEIYVKVALIDITSAKRKLIADAYFTFVASNNNDRSIPIAEISPQSNDEKKQYEQALERKERRKNK